MAGEMAERIGARIRERRTELGMKQRELADMLGSDAIDNQRISDWERGVNRPSDRYMEKLATALQRDVSWFFREDVNAETPDPFPAPAVEGELASILQAIKDQLAAQTATLGEMKDVLGEIKTLLQTEKTTAETTKTAVEKVDKLVQRIDADVRARRLPRRPPASKAKASKTVAKRNPPA